MDNNSVDYFLLSLVNADLVHENNFN